MTLQWMAPGNYPPARGLKAPPPPPKKKDSHANLGHWMKWNGGATSGIDARSDTPAISWGMPYCTGPRKLESKDEFEVKKALYHRPMVEATKWNDHSYFKKLVCHNRHSDLSILILSHSIDEDGKLPSLWQFRQRFEIKYNWPLWLSKLSAKTLNLPKHDPVPLWRSRIQEVVAFDVLKDLLMEEYSTPKANWAPLPSMNIMNVQQRTTQDQPESTSLLLPAYLPLRVFAGVITSSSFVMSNIGSSSLSSSESVSQTSLYAEPISSSQTACSSSCGEFSGLSPSVPSTVNVVEEQSSNPLKNRT